jgi:hypothetical protein
MSKRNEDFKISGHRENQSSQLKSKFSQLTFANLKYESGEEKELLGCFERQLNEWQSEMLKLINKSQKRKV